jgi:hypothetical protein
MTIFTCYFLERFDLCYVFMVCLYCKGYVEQKQMAVQNIPYFNKLDVKNVFKFFF